MRFEKMYKKMTAENDFLLAEWRRDAVADDLSGFVIELTKEQRADVARKYGIGDDETIIFRTGRRSQLDDPHGFGPVYRTLGDGERRVAWINLEPDQRPPGKIVGEIKPKQ